MHIRLSTPKHHTRTRRTHLSTTSSCSGVKAPREISSSVMTRSFEILYCSSTITGSRRSIRFSKFTCGEWCTSKKNPRLGIRCLLLQTCNFGSPFVGAVDQVLPGLMAENDWATPVHPVDPLIQWLIMETCHVSAEESSTTYIGAERLPIGIKVQFRNVQWRHLHLAHDQE